MLLDSTGRPIYSALPVPVPFRLPGYGPTKNLHLLVERRFMEWNAFLLLKGGENVYRGPMYRLVWGWQRPELYGLGDATHLEYFHLERWDSMALYDEDEWDERELSMARKSDKYRIQPFPRQGDYFEIETCVHKSTGPDGKRKLYFRVPDEGWLMWRLALDFERRNRTKADIAAQVKESQEIAKQFQIERYNRISDDMGIRDLAEKETALLIRNPSLRNDQSLMLAPD